MVTLERNAGTGYICSTGTAPLVEVAVRAKPMPDEFINDEGNFINDGFMEYLKPLTGPLPEYTSLNYKPVNLYE